MAYAALTAFLEGNLPADLDNWSHAEWLAFVIDRYNLKGKPVEECGEKLILLMDAAAKRGMEMCQADATSSAVAVSAKTPLQSGAEDAALDHLRDVLEILADLHPDDRCRALDEALAFYNAAMPDCAVKPFRPWVTRLIMTDSPLGPPANASRSAAEMMARIETLEDENQAFQLLLDSFGAAVRRDEWAANIYSMQRGAGFTRADKRRANCPNCLAPGMNTGWGYWLFECGAEMLSDETTEPSTPCPKAHSPRPIEEPALAGDDASQRAQTTPDTPEGSRPHHSASGQSTPVSINPEGIQEPSQ